MSVFFKVNGTVRIRRFERDLVLGKISEVPGCFWLKTRLAFEETCVSCFVFGWLNPAGRRDMIPAGERSRFNLLKKGVTSSDSETL